MNKVIKKCGLQSSELSSVLFLIYLLLKPFYFFASGSIQPGDCFLLLAFVLVLLKERNGLKIKDAEMVFFVFLVAVINVSYYLFYQAPDFLKSTLYYIFNLLAIICFRNMMYKSVWLKYLVTTCKLNLLIQLFCFFLKIGKYWMGTYRYMGTYRDPNQLGFAIISTLAIIYLFDDKRKYFYFFVSAFLIFQTASSGMLLALVLLSLFDFIILCRNILIKGMSIKFIILLIILIISLLFFLLVNGSISIDLRGFRIEQKINRGSSFVQTFISDRKLNVAFEHPVYFLFGYGEGFKFERYGYSGEMHSTWISLCFYYGIFPFIILLKWIYNNIRGIPIKYAPVYIAIFIEAFTLINHRQPIFWMIIMIGSLLRKDERNSNVLTVD